jgi:intraflagellar transport protein 172
MIVDLGATCLHFSQIYGSGLAANANVPPQFQKYLMISHLKSLQSKCNETQELVAVSAKLAIALLRYTKELRPDAAFLEAGQAAKVHRQQCIIECH